MDSLLEEADFDLADIDERVQRDYIQGYIEQQGIDYVPWQKRSNNLTIRLDFVGTPIQSFENTYDSAKELFDDHLKQIENVDNSMFIQRNYPEQAPKAVIKDNRVKLEDESSIDMELEDNKEKDSDTFIQDYPARVSKNRKASYSVIINYKK